MRGDSLKRVVPDLAVIGNAIFSDVSEQRIGTRKVRLGDDGGRIVRARLKSVDTYEWVHDLSNSCVIAYETVASTFDIALRVPCRRDVLDIVSHRIIWNAIPHIGDIHDIGSV